MSREFNRYVEKQFALRMKSFNLEPTKASGPIAWPGERTSVAGPLVDDAMHVIEFVGLPLIAQADLARSAFLENAT